VKVVPIYSTCQWTAASTFRCDAEDETPKFWLILIRVFLQPIQGQTDRQTFNQV